MAIESQKETKHGETQLTNTEHQKPKTELHKAQPISRG
jgi:hypothetical protein